MSRTESPHSPDDYLFLKYPIPLADTKRVGVASKIVWTRIFTYLRSDRTRHLSSRLLSKISGIDRRNLPRVVRELEREGLLEVRIRRDGGRKLTEYRPLWPEWLAAEGESLLLTRVQKAVQKDSVLANGKEEDGPDRYRGDTGDRYRGDTGDRYRGDTTKRVVEESTRRDRAPTPPALEEPGDVDPEADAGEEPYEDDGSASRKRGTASASTQKEGAPRKRRIPKPGSGEEYAETPSERPEYLAWRSRDSDASWRNADLVGYWVVRFREVLGREDPDFVGGTFGSGNYGSRAVHGVRAYVDRQLEGSVERWRSAVDKVLSTAPARGKPVAFAYFFGSPYNGGVLASLDRTPGSGRKRSPREINDERGADLAYWREESRKQTERWRKEGII